MRGRFASWLGKRFGPKRGLALYAVSHEWAGLAVGLSGVAVLIGLIAYFFAIEPNRHAGFETAQVNSVLPWPSDSGPQKLVLDVTLNTGQSARLVTRESGALMGIGNSVCVEKRTSLTSSRSWYRLVPHDKCTAP